MSSTITATGHQHRLGPFDTDADPSEHDEAIVALAGAILEECQTCHDSRLAAIVASTPALQRLIELVGRGHTGNTGPLRGLHPSTEPIADLVDLPPAEREAVLERLVDEDRAASLTGTAARLLVGAWMPRHIQAENPSFVAAAIQQVTDRYHLPEPDADGPAWAWAVLSETTPTSEDTAARRQATVTALHLAATADADNDYLLTPIALGGTGGHGEADLVLTALGWAPAWPPAWPTRGWHQLDGQHRQAMRVRRDAPAPSTPVPYGDTVQWQLDTDRYYPYNDSTAGPPPGRVRYALQVIARSARQDEHGQPSLDERTVEAHQTVALCGSLV